MTYPPASYPDPNPVPPRPAPVALRLPSSPPRVTYTLLAVTIGVYLLQMLSQALLGYDLLIEVGAKSNELIRAGELWRLFTPILLHGEIWHIAINMYTLITLGSSLERRFGHLRYLLIYVLSGFAGNAFSFIVFQGDSFGASSSIFGLIAAEAVFLFQNRILFGKETKHAIGTVVVFVLGYLVIGFSSNESIDSWSHIGGVLGGSLFTWFSGPLWEEEGTYPLLHLVDRRRGGRDVVVGMASVLLIFSSLAILGLLQ